MTSFYQKVIGLLWPTAFKAEESFMKQVGDLVKKEIETHVREKAILELEGIGVNMSD